MGVITTAVATLFGGDPTTAFIASVATAVALFATWFLWRLNTKDGARDQTAPPFIWKEVPPSDHVPGQDPAPGAHSRLSSTRLPVEEQRVRSKAFYNLMASRRSLRFFSSDPIDQEVLDTVVATAGTAPSGAHKQPYVPPPSLSLVVSPAAFSGVRVAQMGLLCGKGPPGPDGNPQAR